MTGGDSGDEKLILRLRLPLDNGAVRTALKTAMADPLALTLVLAMYSTSGQSESNHARADLVSSEKLVRKSAGIFSKAMYAPGVV